MTAFVNPSMASFDNQLPFGNTHAQHLEDHDANGVPSSAIFTDDFDPEGLSLWTLHPHQQLPSARLDNAIHSAVPRTPFLLGNNSSTASASGPSTNSSVKGSPLAHSVMTNTPHPTVMSMPEEPSSHAVFDSTFGMSMPDGSLPDFMAAGGDDRLSGFVGEYDIISPVSFSSVSTAARFPSGQSLSSSFSSSHEFCTQAVSSPVTADALPCSHVSCDKPGTSTSIDYSADLFPFKYPNAPLLATSQASQARVTAWHPSSHEDLQQAKPAHGRFFNSPLSMSPQIMAAPQPPMSSFSPSSPSSYSSRFFGQSSGNYVAPLESSYPSLLQPSSGPTSQPTMAFSIQPPPGSTRPNTLIQHNSADSTHSGSHHFKKSRSNSPFLTSQQSAWQPYPLTSDARRISSHSFGGPNGNGSTRSNSSEAEDREKGRCPFADCGKVFKDLKAHMLTHQNERPEKCPIPSCEYNKKGFSRKYDKNRHTLTHYKGTMICGFCPGSGSAAEKSFNRADVFKRHLTTVHNVEQAPPNSKKKQASAAKKDMRKAPGSTGKCSICSNIFQTPQDFYEHLEECVLDVVQKVDPGEAINEAILASMADDKETNDTIKRHAIADPHGARDGDADSDDDGEDQDDKAKPPNWQTMQARLLGSTQHAGDGTPTPSLGSSSTGPSGLPSADHKSHGRGPGITYSASGIPFQKQPRKRRKNYPNSWGCSADKMKMKKRVLTVFDGCNRLVKDDLMISSDFEVRMNLNLPAQPGQSSGGQLVDSGAYVTDLDVETLRRAEGFFQATEEEKGPWKWTNVPGSVPGQGVEVDLEGLMA